MYKEMFEMILDKDEEIKWVGGINVSANTKKVFFTTLLMGLFPPFAILMLGVPYSLIFLLLSLLTLGLSFKKIFNFEEKNEYNKKLQKILKMYDNVIIEITSPINIDDYEIIEVKGIDEMVDLEEELRIPINFYEHIPNYNIWRSFSCLLCGKMAFATQGRD